MKSYQQVADMFKLFETHALPTPLLQSSHQHKCRVVYKSTGLYNYYSY